MFDPNQALDLLRQKKLPRMVQWYNPKLLTRIGVRTMVSTVFGQYADQRLIQAATDPADDKNLIERYDYRDPTPEHPLDRVALDETGAYYIDYIADTGDGFESTYTTAYLLAIDHLKVPGLDQPLPAADTLIMGGDQCYPQATREEYKTRFVTPFSWAYDVPEPKRKIFAIPGNHDWYDGLNAFDSLFCAARDRLSEANPTAIGGWQCQQHRSYWALRLPYNWWIWGVDIQFSKYLDTAQTNYFELIAQQMGPEDKLLICIAEPSWLITDLLGEDEDENFFKITTIARKRGSRICAVVAGDWHHYNRYYSNELDVHFLTAGGGGSFLHPTHGLRDAISVRWPKRATDAEAEVAKASATKTDKVDTAGWKHAKVDISLRKDSDKKQTPREQVAEGVKEAVEEVLKPLGDAAKGKTPVKRTRLLKKEAPTCYPSRGRSRVLSLMNLAFPFYNFWFALGIGFIYWLITWEFYSIAGRHDISAGKIDAVGVHTGYLDTFSYFPLYLMQACLVSIPLAGMLAGLLALLIWYVAAPERPRWKHWLMKLGLGGTHFLAHLTVMFGAGLFFVMINNWVSPTIEQQVNKIWRDSSKAEGVIARGIKEALEPLSTNRQEQREMFEDKSAKPGDIRRSAPPASAIPGAADVSPADTAIIAKGIRQIVGFILYPFQIILLGGILGGFVWGLYWVITSILFRIHGEDAFAALRIHHYKNFLRMKFERDKLTIYPIGIDRVPPRSFWTSRNPKHPRAHNPVLVAPEHIDVRLIEQPIVIHSNQDDDHR